MFSIRRLTCEGLDYAVTDNLHPLFQFCAESDRNDTSVASATLSVNGWSVPIEQGGRIRYEGPALRPYTTYTASVHAVSDQGETAERTISFSTGCLTEELGGAWISDPQYRFTEKKISPKPMRFRRRFPVDKKVESASLYITALGIYCASLNGTRVGDLYLTPGFTSYKHSLQYQTYNITEYLKDNNELLVDVSGGWACGSFVFTRVNRVYADRQALRAAIRVTYSDGSVETIGTDNAWEVTTDGPCTMADLYDGESFNASCNSVNWHPAAEEKLRISPKLQAAYGAPVRIIDTVAPVSVEERSDGFLLDFGQNLAGVVSFTVQGHKGQVITLRHAEILNDDGELNTAFLRTAKQTISYTCREGEQSWAADLTYMGFRYVRVQGIDAAHFTAKALVLSSAGSVTGRFSCSDPLINRLQENIIWSARANFMDIPTDCPQRDERMGWTGDIAVFSPTACLQFDVERFLTKWLLDVKDEQLKTGGIPNTVPAAGYGFPATMPTMAIDFWGDACVLVPWAMYQATGNREILSVMFPTMRKYVDACRFWAGLLSFGDRRYLWKTPSVLHFGDWVAPDVPKMQQWQARSPWTATASLVHTSDLLSQIAEILGNLHDRDEYAAVSKKAAGAYRKYLTDGNGKLTEEFQTGYVLPLAFGIFKGEEKEKAAANLVSLVRKNNWKIGTGFPGTPWLLFALCDNGYVEDAWKMLSGTQCPSWLYEVKQGATSIWERWDGLDENGKCPISNDGTDMMISYNHYASGAVEEFLARRVAGLEPLTPGYQTFRFAPVCTGTLTEASVFTETPYGRISVSWKRTASERTLIAEVPIGTTCEVVLADGSIKTLSNGKHVIREEKVS